MKKYRFGKTDTEDQVGIVTGLAWTSVGGDILTIEAVSMAGKGQMKITGNLKDVMKESISAAKSYVQSKAPELGVSPRRFGQRIFMSMCPKARRRRTARPRASAWSRRLSLC